MHSQTMKGIAGHFRRLLRLLRRRGHTREDAEDLIQDAFLSLHTYCQKAEVRSAEAFLVRAAVNRSISFNRGQHRDLYVTEPLEELMLTDETAAPDEVLAADQRLERITRALNSVGPRTRDMFLMHRLLGFSYPEIARQLGVTVSAVERRIARAINAVTIELQQDS
jgi:RNA polymerase sigma factor (sigma-70 family)